MIAVPEDLALKATGAVQATRWTNLPDGGYIYSFNGPHSLFVDTVRSCRALMVSHKLGHCLMGEGDQPINLLERAIGHIESTAKYSIFYDEGRDRYDEWGRTAHECVFNLNDGAFRCPNAQQGFSGFTTWTRGLAWAKIVEGEDGGVWIAHEGVSLWKDGKLSTDCGACYGTYKGWCGAKKCIANAIL